MMGDMQEEWKNITVIRIYKKGDKNGNHRGIGYFMHVISKILNFTMKK